jgi:hypothetical protein
MGDGYGRRWWKRLALLAFIPAVTTPAAYATGGLAVPLCPIPGQSDGVGRGVNRTNLAWERNWQTILNRMDENGVMSVRLTLTQPLERSGEIATEAHRRGMRVLMNVPLSLRDYYNPAVEPRPGNDKIRSIRRLSDLDIVRYAGTLQRFLEDLDRRGGLLDALEVGNEINWADFNGDLPVGLAGGIFDESTLARLPERMRVLEGFRKYKEALETSRQILQSSRAGRSALLIAAGLYAPGPWVKQSQGSALALSTTKAIFDELGISALVDAFALHVYPPVGRPGETSFAETFSALRASTQLCGTRTGDGKPCFITEWGYANTSGTACWDDHERLEFFEIFERALSCLDHERDIVAAYLFSWDESPQFSVWRCDRLLNGGQLFGNPPIK